MGCGPGRLLGGGLSTRPGCTHHMTPEGFPTCRAAWRLQDDEQRAIVLHYASTEESRYWL